VDRLFKVIILLYATVIVWSNVDTRADGLFRFLHDAGYNTPGLIGDLALAGVVLTGVYILVALVKAVKK
jgi:hypothetical protein